MKGRTMKDNPLRKAAEFGQSIWLDFLRRHLIESGELQQLIDEDGLRGLTSNPKIFQKAIGGSDDYDERIRALAHEGKSVDEIYQTLTVDDVRDAADRLRPLHDESDGQHGFVSLEVSPHLARQTDATISEARSLWQALDRPNVFIKVPATREGLPAIEQLIAAGINVNVTLLFGLPRYREVADAYLRGLQQRVEAGAPIKHVASVASFFLSRIDVLVDSLLEDRMNAAGDNASIAHDLHGQVAIACARIAYQIYKQIYAEERFRTLAEQGARAQRLLWASTSTKNPDYSDVKYVDALIGPDTVNTLPRETLDAYRDHGDPARRLEEDVDGARRTLQELADLGIEIDEVTEQLVDEGIEKFNKPFDKLMQTLDEERKAALDECPDRQVLHLGAEQSIVDEQLDKLRECNFVKRLWRKDPTLWNEAGEAQDVIRNGLGWLHVAETMESNLGGLMRFVQSARDAGFQHVVHMGMGGSSLAPLTFERTLREQANGLPLTVLDTTDPATIAELERRVPLAETLFIVASKSGTTTETRAFGDYFYERVRRVKGDSAGENFVAITDAGTPLAKLAEELNFRHCFKNMPDIGGRYSALSYFGLVPAALSGVDVEEVLARALLMAHACSSCVPIERNPGIVLGAALGALAQHGRDKITFLMPDGITTLGMWLEQLLAESTGKEGTGLVPVADEPVGEPDAYGHDRLFIHFRVEREVAPKLETRVRALEEAGHPLIRIVLQDHLDIAQEFFRWEIATATAGAVLGINAFDQPNVQESKDNTARLLNSLKRDGRLSEEAPSRQVGPLSLYGDVPGEELQAALAHFMSPAEKGDYFALMAYVMEQPATEKRLQRLRALIRDHLRSATTLGYGPRFLHSTGQLHKGGPNVGRFLQLTADDERDVDIPDRPYCFGTLKQAQALGDLQALRKHDRSVIRIHLGNDVDAGLEALEQALQSAIAASAQAAVQ
jgi:transaldolase/glucose-6-phosphate isomerase